MLIIVTGFGRCGSSMMMEFLQKGGIEIKYEPDYLPIECNPRGYFEIEKPHHFLADPRSYTNSVIAVKALARTLRWVPFRFRKDHCKIIWMGRPFEHVQQSMENVKRIAKLERSQIDAFDMDLVRGQCTHELKSFAQVMIVPYEGVLKNPRGYAFSIAEFLREPNFNVDAAAAVVDPTLCHYSTKGE